MKKKLHSHIYFFIFVDLPIEFINKTENTLTPRKYTIAYESNISRVREKKASLMTLISLGAILKTVSENTQDLENQLDGS